MKKTETIWHHLLFSALAEKRFKHTQQELAGKFGYSLSTIHHALIIPSQSGAVRKEAKYFVLQDFQKLLYLWASTRRLEKDIIYQTRVSEPVSQIEGLIPPPGIYAAYSAARKILGEPPADYDKIYFYLKKELLPQAQQRFPPPGKKEASNLFVLEMPEAMPSYGPVTTLPQTFVDLWNLKEWYAKDFLAVLETKIGGILS